MNRFALIVHGTGLPAAGVACIGHFHAGGLVLEAGIAQRVALTGLSVSVGGFDDDQIFLNWQEGELKYSAMPADAAARAALLASAPETLQPALRKGQGAAHYQQAKWQALLGLAALAVLAVGLLYWQSDALTAWLARQVPMASEKRLGETVLAQVKSDGKLTQAGPAAEAVRRIGEKLTAGSRYHYEWYVKADKSINAFAIPGGFVVVHSGLLTQVDNGEELAGVLAHEVQHVERRHSLQQMIHTAGWAAMLAVTLGDVSAITAVMIHQMGNLRHGRKLESEADRAGMQALARAGIPLTGMTRFFKKLADDKAGAEGGLAFTLLSSHPAGPERLAALERLAKLTPCVCKPLPYDRATVQAAAKAFEAGAATAPAADKEAAKSAQRETLPRPAAGG